MGNEVLGLSRIKNSKKKEFLILKGAHLREEIVDDGEREFVDVLVAVLLQSLNLVQTLALLYHQTHLIHQPSLGGRLQQHKTNA